MALDRHSLKRLRRRMPNGYLRLAQAALSAQDRDVSDSYVSAVMHGDKFDQGVIEVLIAIAEEHQARLTELKLRARGVRQSA